MQLLVSSLQLYVFQILVKSTMNSHLLFLPDDEAEEAEEELREEDGGAILTTSATATTPFDVL